MELPLSNSASRMMNAWQETAFIPRGLRLEFLKNCPEVIPTIADWMYAEWRLHDAQLTKEKLVQGFKKRLNDDHIPFTLVALRGDIPAGIVSLKIEEDPELTKYAPGTPWLGSLQVSQEERNKGLGSALLEAAKALARCLGHDTLYLFTSNPANVPWYEARGAKVIESRPYRTYHITVMNLKLADYTVCQTRLREDPSTRKAL